VCAPTLLIVGGNDAQVIGLNRAAFSQLRCEKEVTRELIPVNASAAQLM
jgi:hypothetical protein